MLNKLTQTKQGEKMKIKTKSINHWSGTQYKVYVDGIKYPKPRGLYYSAGLADEYKNKEKAIEWAIAESKGKFVSGGGVVYESKEQFLNQIEDRA
tara:strand:- start:147 stop:431 length:285 start_codon:yes stop_codon:yes gene_type:complete